jgi:putative FmdB family regulatory protein
MPIYEYLCDKCEHEFEAEQRITDDPIRSCPRCRSRKVRRLISQTSFVLKGGGWYSDLYSSGKSKPDAPAPEGAAESKTAGDSKPATESKPESKQTKDSKKGSEPGGKRKKASAQAAA